MECLFSFREKREGSEQMQIITGDVALLCDFT